MANGQSKPVVGFLNSGSAEEFTDFAAAFRAGLNGAGFQDARNVAIEYRWADGRYDRLPDLARELVRIPVAVIAATGGIVSARAAQAATSTIPILFISGVNPVKAGLVDSLERPGSNATGINVGTTELLADRLKCLREMVPGAEKIGILVNPKSFVASIEADEMQKAKLIVLTASTASELATAFNNAVKQGAGALLVSADPFFTSQRKVIVELASQHALPTAYPWQEYATVGGLMSYGPSLSDAYKEVGTYVGEILKGSGGHGLAARSKAVLPPVRAASKLEMIINNKTASTHKLSVPGSLRQQAYVIE